MSGVAQVIIAIQGVYKAFGAQEVHKGVELQIYRGEVITILGGSGSGKSVLLKEIVGLIKPDKGSILLFGEDIVPLDEKGLFQIRQKVGVVFQSAALFDSLSVFENVAYPLTEVMGKPSAEVRPRVLERLRWVGLGGAEGKFPSELSGGMQKRVGLARAMVLDPEVILFDEPTTGLDPSNVRNINELILRLNQEQGTTAVVVTHDIASAEAVSHRWALLKEGRVESVGSPDELKRSPNPYVRRFIEGRLLEEGGES
jgi:phospholipid/cholesterol/gamma-HCH transport system ATP-binding protein